MDDKSEDEFSCDVTRRRLLQWTGASLGSLAVGSRALCGASSVAIQSEYGRPLQEFHYDQIEYRPGPHDEQLEQTHSVLMSLNEDSILWPLRRNAGLPTPGQSLNGFYEGDAEIIGPFISALARYYAIRQHEPTRAKANRLVEGVAQTLEPTGKVFGDKVNAAKYARLLRALLDAHLFTSSPIALDTLNRLTEAVAPRFPAEATNTSAGGWTLQVPESQFLAWQCTGMQSHLALAKKYLYEEFFECLARGENCLANRNALSHADALCSAAKAYLVLGDEKYLRALKNGFAFIEAQSYATGGWGPIECFIPSSRPWGESGTPDGWMPEINTLGESLKVTHWHFQTAPGAHVHFNLARYLLRITKEATYGDSLERVMYNTVLGALPLKPSGMAFYNADYHSDGHKTYFDNYGFIGDIGPEWPLEAGMLPLVAADYRINTYFRDDEGVYVNLFIPSTLKWQHRGISVSLTQSGTYPLGEKIHFEVGLPEPLEFVVRFRIPAWAQKPSIRVNGKAILASIKPGTFATFKKIWRNGDQIELELPRQLVLKAIDAEHPDLVALVYEPLVLFAVAKETPSFTRQQLLAAEHVSPDGHEWRVTAGNQAVRFTPFWAIKYERYSSYFSVVS